MRILLNENIDHRLRNELSEHETQTVTEMGWSGKLNGELLALADTAFGVSVTILSHIEPGLATEIRTK